MCMLYKTPNLSFENTAQPTSALLLPYRDNLCCCLFGAGHALRSGCELQAQARHAGPSSLYMPQTPQLPRAVKLIAAAAAAVLHELYSVVVFVVHVRVVLHVVSYFSYGLGGVRLQRNYCVYCWCLRRSQQWMHADSASS